MYICKVQGLSLNPYTYNDQEFDGTLRRTTQVVHVGILSKKSFYSIDKGNYKKIKIKEIIYIKKKKKNRTCSGSSSSFSSTDTTLKGMHNFYNIKRTITRDFFLSSRSV